LRCLVWLHSLLGIARSCLNENVLHVTEMAEQKVSESAVQSNEHRLRGTACSATQRSVCLFRGSDGVGRQLGHLTLTLLTRCASAASSAAGADPPHTQSKISSNRYELLRSRTSHTFSLPPLQ
jgi:hypothetical protein